MNFDIDILIVGLFLLVNLVVGLYYGKGVRTIKDYALGGRNFNTATLTATIVATWIAGSSLEFNILSTYDQGLYFVLNSIGDALSFLIIGYLISPYLAPYLGKLSVAEVIGDCYGNKTRQISAVAAVLPSVANIAMQFSVISILLKTFFAINSGVIILICLLVVIYSAIGGIKSVVFTDIIQFITFGIIIPILAILVWQSLENNNSFFSMFNDNDLFNYKSLFKNNSSESLKTLLLFLFFIIPGFDPALFQRLSAVKSVQQVKASCLYTCIIIGVIYLIMDFIGALILAKGTELASGEVLYKAIFDYVGYGTKGMLLIGIIAMAMSTADSYINTSAVIITYDVFKTLGFKIKTDKEIYAVRIIAMLTGIVAIIISMYSSNWLDMILFTYGFYMPVVSVPLLLIFFGFRSTSRVIITGMTASIVLVSLVRYFSEMDSLILGMLVNLLTIFSLHYFLGEPGGWINEKTETKIDLVREAKTLISRGQNLLKDILSFKTYEYYLPKQDIIYGYFAFVVFMSGVVTLSIDKAIYNENYILLNTMQIIAFSIATFFACNSVIPLFKNNRYFGAIWVASIFISCSLISSFLAIFSNFSHLSLTILTIYLTLIPILVGWKISLLMMLLGFWGAVVLYQNQIADLTTISIDDIKTRFIYIALIIGGFSLTILRNKQEYIEETEIAVGSLKKDAILLNYQVGEQNNKISTLEQTVENLNDKVGFFAERVNDQEAEIERLGATSQKILNNVTHELRLPVGNVMNFAELLSGSLHKLPKEELKELSDEVLKNSARLSSMIMNMLDLMMLDVKKVQLKKTIMNLGELAKERITRCAKIYLGDKPINIRMKIEPELLVWVDPNYIKQVIDNLVINSIKFSAKGTIEVQVRSENDKAIITVQDEGIGINEYEIYDIFTPFKMGTNTKAEGRGIGLALCKSAIEAHGGTIAVQSINGYTSFKVELSLPSRNMIQGLLDKRS